MHNLELRFACNGCGVCCKGRLIPLTLEEARQWLHRGHDVAVILEAFNESAWPAEPAKFAHHVRRAAEVDSGTTQIKVIAILAANALTQCPHLDAQNRCGLYEQRPLVCRIYPAEISPFINLNPALKVCPPEVWEAGEIIHSQRNVDPTLAWQVEQARAADREDAQAKVAICELLGLHVAAWKDNALAIYLPERSELMTAIQQYDSGMRAANANSWQLRIDDAALRQSVIGSGAKLADAHVASYIFHKV